MQLPETVLVTGGAGFLGRHLIDALLQQPAIKVVVFDMVELKHKDARVVSVRGDLTDRDQVVAALKSHGAQLVFHVAAPNPNGTNKAVSGPLLQLDPFPHCMPLVLQIFKAVNVTGTQNVIAACLATGVKALVYTSSASVVWEGMGQEGPDESIPYPTS